MSSGDLKRNPVLAAVLSLALPGLGQIYAGALRRGLTLMIGLPVQALLFYGVGLDWLMGWIAVVWLWSVYDAARTARGHQTSAMLPILLLLALNIIAATSHRPDHRGLHQAGHSAPAQSRDGRPKDYCDTI